MNRLIKRIISSISDSEDYLIVDGKEASRPEYQLIKKNERKTLSAVDGGSSIIVQTPSHCVLFVRIIKLTIKPDMSKTITRKEGFIVSMIKKRKIVVRAYFDKVEDLFEVIPEGEDPLLDGANTGRKLTEWRTCNSEEDENIVWDGCFSAKYDFERKTLETLNKVAALSKTTRALGSISRFFKEAPENPWYAKVGENIYFAKLNKRSKHIFRIDSANNNIANNDIISELAPWSDDMTFPGYPYPLILADQIARVSNSESSSLKARFESMGGDLSGESAVNAHSILDSIQF